MIFDELTLEVPFQVFADLVSYSGKRYIGKDLGVSEPGKAPPQDASDRWIFTRYTVQKGWYHYVPEDRLHKELKSETLNKPHEHVNLKVQQSALPPLVNCAPLVPPLNCLKQKYEQRLKYDRRDSKLKYMQPSLKPVGCRCAQFSSLIFATD